MGKKNNTPEKANPDTKKAEILSLGDNKFNVASEHEKGKYYLVDMNTKWCECPAFYYQKQECKHMKAVKELIGKEGNK